MGLRAAFALAIRRTVRILALGIAIAASTAASSAAASYRIEALYSNLAGWFQYIQLRENSADGKVGPLAGSVITVKHGDVVKHYMIPTDPPAGFPAGGSLIISSEDADWVPDYVMPDEFVPANGGTIDLDGQDVWIFGALPLDGSTALFRDGTTGPASGESFALGPFSVHVEFDNAVEYYDASLDDYFLTAFEWELDAFDSGQLPGWQETGYSLGVLTVPIPQYCCSTYGKVAVPVCRFYIPPPWGDTHFYSAIPEECAAIPVKFPQLVLETSAAFYVYVADSATGVCPYPFVPVYRVWNPHGAAHRYINDLVLRQQMLDQGWVPEGYGPLGVAWCQ